MLQHIWHALFQDEKTIVFPIVENQLDSLTKKELLTRANLKTISLNLSLSLDQGSGSSKSSL